MKMNQNTANYLESTKHPPVIINEAQKQKIKEHVKTTSLWGMVVISMLSALTLGIMVAVTYIQDFFQNNEIVFAQPIEVAVKTNKVVTVKPVEKTKTVLVENTKVEEIIAKEEKPSTAKKICDKFGAINCQTALAVSKGEGYYHPVDGWNLNTNGTIDVGYFRINSDNFGIPGCSHAEVVTEDGNINCAYIMWDRADGKVGNGQGRFNPWVAYTTGKYIAHL